MQVLSRHGRSLGLVAFIALVASSVGCRDLVGPTTERVATSASAASKTPGYLLPEARPDSIALLPPPPAPGSSAQQADIAVYRDLTALVGTARWELAAADADLKFPQAANTFACALGFDIDPVGAPRLYTLLQRMIIDAGQSTYAAKQKYARKRPFEDTGDATCVPVDEKALRGSASYPSGHASLGHAWGEVLAEIAPDRAQAVRARAYEFGQSRVICRVHWQSDVAAGRLVGGEVVQQLHRNADFRADLNAAKREARIARQRVATHGRDCQREAMVLAQSNVP